MLRKDDEIKALIVGPRRVFEAGRILLCVGCRTEVGHAQVVAQRKHGHRAQLLSSNGPTSVPKRAIWSHISSHEREANRTWRCDTPIAPYSLSESAIRTAGPHSVSRGMSQSCSPM